MEFSKLERVAIEAILSKPVEGMEYAQRQFAVASVAKRDCSGVGFFTTISVPSSALPMPDSRELRDALRDGAGGSSKSDPEGFVQFMLWADDSGRLTCLEGYTIGDAWPYDDDIEIRGPCERR